MDAPHSCRTPADAAHPGGCLESLTPRLRANHWANVLSWAPVCLFVALASAPSANGAEQRDELVQALLQRLAALEQRVQRQEEELTTLRRDGSAAIASNVAPAHPLSVSAAPAPPIQTIGETADSWSESHAPMLTLRGFGDVEYRWRRKPTNTNAFAVGQIDLFVTSKIAEELHLLNENVIKVDFRGTSNVEAERLLIRYSPSDYFNISAGRFHAAIGFYNTAYHHGSWFQTAVGRPLPFRPESLGGILPGHNVGITIEGAIPGRISGLRYTIEVGNGRDYRPGAPVQQMRDNNDQKSVNVALTMNPESMPGLQAGISYLTDRPMAPGGPGVTHQILALHAVYQRPTVEWLNEVIFMRNQRPGSPARNSHAYYTQFGRSFGAFRPFVRYHLLDVAKMDPLLASSLAGRTHGPSFGVRYNLSNFTAVKLQFDRLWHETTPTTDDVTVQWAFTF